MAISYLDNGGFSIFILKAYNVNVSFPATVSANDILIMQVIISVATTFNAVADWTLEAQDVDTGSQATFALYSKRATGSESGTVNVTANGTELIGGIISRFSGCVESGAYIEGLNAAYLRQTNSLRVPSLTTTGANRLAVFCAQIEDDVLPSAYPGSWVEEWTFDSALQTDQAVLMALQAAPDTDTIAEGECTYTGTDSVGSFSFALIPATGGVDTLTAQNIAAGAVAISQPTLGQIHITGCLELFI